MPPPQDEVPVRLGSRKQQAAALPPEPALSAFAVMQTCRLSLALRSVAALCFGIGFVWPSLTQTTLDWLFAGYAFLDGVLAVSAGGWTIGAYRAWPLLVGGGLSIVGGAVAYVWPSMTLLALGNISAVWAVAIGAGFLATYAAVREADHRHLFFLCALAALVFGRALLSQLADDVIILSTWMALYTLTISVLFLKLTLQHYELWLE
jgi:uncharacterized membrane protein HdeD (DUF308 family)